MTILRNYHAFEIDKYAEAVSRFNYPDIIRHGDVHNVDLVCSQLTPHERTIPTLLMGGSPCQDFSFAGHQKGFKGDRGALFFQFVEAMNILKPTYFLLENVMMTQKNQDIMSKYLGVKPVMINSQDFSAHHRKRLYFTNIPILPYIDRGVVLSDIIEDGYQDIEIEFKDIYLWIDDSTLVDAIAPTTGSPTKKVKITLTEENPSSTGDKILIQNLYHESTQADKPIVTSISGKSGKKVQLHKFRVSNALINKSLTEVIEGAATYQHNNSNSNVAYSTYAPQAYSILGVPGYGGAQGVAPKYMMREKYIYNLKVEFEEA